jgi:hypothetical protein
VGVVVAVWALGGGQGAVEVGEGPVERALVAEQGAGVEQEQVGGGAVGVGAV